MLHVHNCMTILFIPNFMDGYAAKRSPGMRKPHPQATATWLLFVVAIAAAQHQRQCVPPVLPQLQNKGVPIPALPPGQRPNFIIILTDDQGYDDVGLHHPAAAAGEPALQTPNLDRFIKGGMDFRNFYVAPYCAVSRAQLLTGRYFPRTGTMLNHGGYDFLHKSEANAGALMAEAGYRTAHFGKWHNGRVLGYEPWNVGFQDSWLPTAYLQQDNLMRHNGLYVPTKGLLEARMMDILLSYLTSVEDGTPFFAFYAPYAIHRGFSYPDNHTELYKRAKHNLPTAEAWGKLTYLDEQLGRLFDFVENSSLRNNTYIMIMGDNGPALGRQHERDKDFEKLPAAKKLRMPSGMYGNKPQLYEGGVRNFLAVQGPGVPAGVADETLLSINDILPTMADLAGAYNTTHLPWDGLSFANLLRRNGVASQQQQERVLFFLEPSCWNPNAMPALGPDRRVIRPQQVMDYDDGSAPKKGKTFKSSKGGFERCIAARYKQYKWIGDTGKVWRFQNGSHIELPCNEVKAAERAAVATQMSQAARRWWASVVAEPHSFAKPTFFLGYPGWHDTNVLADGAHERTPDNVTLHVYGAYGFFSRGDRICWDAKVLTAGLYNVSIMISCKAAAEFRVAVGPYADIKAGRAPNLFAKLPQEDNLLTYPLGSMRLKASNDTDICLELLSSSAKPGKAAVRNLANIRFEYMASNSSSPCAGDSRCSRHSSSSSSPGGKHIHQRIWQQLHQQYGWPEGQGQYRESMYSPHDAEHDPEGE